MMNTCDGCEKEAQVEPYGIHLSELEPDKPLFTMNLCVACAAILIVGILCRAEKQGGE